MFRKNRCDYFFADAAISALMYIIHISFLHSWICNPWESSLLITDNKDIDSSLLFISFFLLLQVLIFKSKTHGLDD